MTKINFILVLVISFLLPSILHAQKGDKNFRDRLENVGKEKLISEIQLTDELAQKVIDANRTHRNNMRNLHNSKNELESKMISEKYSDNLNIIIGDFLNVYTEIASEKVRYYNELKGFLTDQKFAEVVNFQTKFVDNLRKEIRKQKRRGNQSR